MTRYFIFLLLLMSYISCSDPEPGAKAGKQTQTPDRATLMAAIKGIEAEFEQKPDKVINKDKARELVEKSGLYVSSFPKDSLNPKLLFRAGEVARFIGDYGKAIQLLGQLHREYPDNIQSPPALFLQAFMYENNLKDKENAKKYYQHFLNKYPDHGLAEQVRTVLRVIDKTPEELVKEFRKKQDQ